MRKIETQMNTAIRNKKNWAGSNTTVFTENDSAYGLESKVYLHGNHIATYNHSLKELELFDGGWQSNTTKSRLNALCSELATGFGVFQKNWDWFVSDRLGNTVDFINGIVIDENMDFDYLTHHP